METVISAPFAATGGRFHESTKSVAHHTFTGHTKHKLKPAARLKYPAHSQNQEILSKILTARRFGPLKLSSSGDQDYSIGMGADRTTAYDDAHQVPSIKYFPKRAKGASVHRNNR